MLYGTSDDPDHDENIRQMLKWFDAIYRFSSYAIISFWIDEKSDQHSVKIGMNMTTGEYTQSRTLKKMKKPKDKKHRRGAKNLEETRSGLTSSNLVERCTSAE